MAMPDTPIPAPPSFWQRRAVRRITQGFAALAVVIVLGVVAYLILGWSLSDSVYMVIISVSGVGYGEVRPIDTPAKRAVTILVIASGMVAVAYTLTGVLQLVTEGEIRKLLGHQRMRRQIDTLSDHTIVAGYGRVGELVCDELAASELPFVVIEKSPDRVPEIEGRGFLYIVGDATDEKVLHDAGLERAKVLVTVTPSDADNVFITLTVRQLNPHVTIVARAEQSSTLKKLRQAGANHVVSPAVIGAHRIVSLLTNPSAVEFAELVTRRSSLAIEMDEIPVKARGPLDGLSLRDADIGRKTGVMVIAVKRADGRVEFPPSGDEPFAAGDSAVILGRRSNLELFRKSFAV
jgi:voltage-gated potassium channel